jgi:para-aminobenzoate synthetase / 4-amino-4-deoxychorismate lyase
LTSVLLGRNVATTHLLQAIDADPDLDTDALFCLSGRWPDGDLIAWEVEQVSLEQIPRGADWLGVAAYQPDRSWWGRFALRTRRIGDDWLIESRRSDIDLAATANRLRDTVDGCHPDHLGQPVMMRSLHITPRESHLRAVERAIIAIRAGQIYQANVCAQVGGLLTGDPLDLFRIGVERLAPARAAFLRHSRALGLAARAVVSMSPETFLDRNGRGVRTSPIKGTRPRGATVGDRSARELQRSAKDRAENIMIVDLMRNDLARVSVTGTVTVPELLDVVAAPGVWHLVSTITSTLEDGATDHDLLAAAFPPGSVTGAPKSRAVQIITEIEPEQRHVFPGAIGYLGLHNRSSLSVAIRTVEIEMEKADGNRPFVIGVGGGITAGSVPMLEWQECLDKVAPLLELAGRTTGSLDNACAAPTAGRSTAHGVDAVVDKSQGVFETMLAVGTRVFGLADHLERLAASTVELFGCAPPTDLPSRIVDRLTFTSGKQRIRLSARPDLELGLAILIELTPAPPLPRTLTLHTVADRPAISWRHKWNDRRYLLAAEHKVAPPGQNSAEPHLPLFTDATRSQVFETSRGNIARLDGSGVLFTPPLTADLLPGIARRQLIDAAADEGVRIEIEPLRLADLYGSGIVVSVNSLGVVPVEVIDGRRLPADAELLRQVRGLLERG